MYRTLLATCGSEKMLTQTVYSPRTTNSHKLQSHTLQARCGTLHFIENERSDKTLFGVFGQGIPALCLEVELLAIAGDEAGT